MLMQQYTNLATLNLYQSFIFKTFQLAVNPIGLYLIVAATDYQKCFFCNIWSFCKYEGYIPPQIIIQWNRMHMSEIQL